MAAYLKQRLEETVPELPAAEPRVEHAEAERSVADLARELLGSDPPGPEVTRNLSPWRSRA